MCLFLLCKKAVIIPCTTALQQAQHSNIASCVSLVGPWSVTLLEECKLQLLEIKRYRKHLELISIKLVNNLGHHVTWSCVIYVGHLILLRQLILSVSATLVVWLREIRNE